MKTLVGIVFLVLASLVYGQDKPQANTVDIDAWRAAQERLQAKQVEKGSEIEQLRAENERLRKRVTELEKILGMSFANTPSRATGHVYTSVPEAVAACRFPLDPKANWTELQIQKARDTARAVLVGEKFNGQMILGAANPEKGFVACQFWREGKDGNRERVDAKFDPRYADVLATWRNATAMYSFEGTINDVVLDKDSDRIEMTLVLADCVPGTKPPVPVKEIKPMPSSPTRTTTSGGGRGRGRW